MLPVGVSPQIVAPPDPCGPGGPCGPGMPCGPGGPPLISIGLIGGNPTSIVADKAPDSIVVGPSGTTSIVASQRLISIGLVTTSGATSMLKGSLMAKRALSPSVSARLYQPILSSDPYQEPRCFSNPKTFGSWLRPVRFLRRGWV